MKLDVIVTDGSNPVSYYSLNVNQFLLVWSSSP